MTEVEKVKVSFVQTRAQAVQTLKALLEADIDATSAREMVKIANEILNLETRLSDAIRTAQLKEKR